MKRWIIIIFMLLLPLTAFAAGEEIYPAEDGESGKWGYTDESGQWMTLYVTQLTGVKYPEAGAAGPVCAGFRPAGDGDAGVYRQRQAMRPRRAAGIPIDPGFVPVR